METGDNTSLRVASFSCYLDKAKENLIHRVSAAQENTNPPTIKPPFSIKFSQPKDTPQSLTNLRVDSFGDNRMFEVSGPIQDPTASFTFSKETPKDGEISVFGADKYFNMKLEYQTDKKYKNKSIPNPKSTPSLCSSESTTIHSQTALLPGSQPKHRRSNRRTIFTGFGCKGPCFDKKSVHTYGSSKPFTPPSSRINHLESLQVKPNQNLDPSRPSIEVFGSKTTSKGDIATNLERKLSMLAWDAIPKGKTLPTSTTICTDDLASEASSDLFEIENISGSINPLLFSSSEPPDHDDLSTCMSPTNYAPTEASIQWSVVTASAADYSILDYNYETSVSVAGDVVSKNAFANKNEKTRKEWHKNRPSGILGCKSHKAVDVAENVCHKSNGKLSQGNRQYPSIY